MWDSQCIFELTQIYPFFFYYRFVAQDVPGLCTTNSLSVNTQCAEQVFFLYNRPNVNNSIPCYNECQPCLTCINQTRQEEQSLNGTLWETVFPEYFAEPPPGTIPAIDDDDDSEEDDDDDDDDDDDSKYVCD